MSLVQEISRAAELADRERARRERRRRQVIEAVARWKKRNPAKVSAQRKRWRRRQRGIE